LSVAAGAIPLPHHTMSEGVVWLPDDAHLRAATPGFMVTLRASPGSLVKTGDVIAQLDDPALHWKLAAQKARVRELEMQLAAEQFADQAKAELLRRTLEDQRKEEQHLIESIERLTIKSHSDGTLVIPHARDLPGRYFREGQLLGYVTPASAVRVRVAVTQDDIELVQHQLRFAMVRLVDRSLTLFEARLAREIPAAQYELPSRVLGSSGGGSFPTDPRDAEGVKTLQRVFQVDLDLSPSPTAVGFGTRALVRFELYWEPLAAQVYRRIRQLFLTQLDV
jgi:putative peptide zinc metalloprotease protein